MFRLGKKLVMKCVGGEIGWGRNRFWEKYVGEKNRLGEKFVGERNGLGEK